MDVLEERALSRTHGRPTEPESRVSAAAAPSASLDDRSRLEHLLSKVDEQLVWAKEEAAKAAGVHRALTCLLKELREIAGIDAAAVVALKLQLQKVFSELSATQAAIKRVTAETAETLNLIAERFASYSA